MPSFGAVRKVTLFWPVKAGRWYSRLLKVISAFLIASVHQGFKVCKKRLLCLYESSGWSCFLKAEKNPMKNELFLVF